MYLNEEIQILDINGEMVLRYWKLDDVERPTYFGGTTHDAYRKWEYGPHVWKPLDSMLKTIAQFADQELTFNLRGGIHVLDIAREMDAEIMAEILQCPVESIVDYFGRVVRVRVKE